MIQRIQSVYLLLAALLMCLALFFNLLVLEDGAAYYFFKAQGIFTSAGERVLATWGVITIGGLASLLPFMTIFLFKKRKLQLRLCNLSILFIILFYATLVTYLFSYLGRVNQTVDMVSYGIIFPIISLVLLLFAKRGIKADEKLVRSLDRLR